MPVPAVRGRPAHDEAGSEHDTRASVQGVDAENALNVSYLILGEQPMLFWLGLFSDIFFRVGGGGEKNTRC